MKRGLSLILMLFFFWNSKAQEETYLTFEFMKVDNDQETFYNETEEFWEKIHEQRIASGDITGWDLWQLLPGGEDQGYQYLTVTVFNDPLKMMRAGEGIMESARMAYPDLSDEELEKRLNMAGGSRDLAVRLFLHVIESTEDDFQMKPGMIASLDLMKARDGQNEAYEQAESNTFKPWHQKYIDAGVKGNWQVLRVLVPQGTDVYTSHITANMYENWEQYIKSQSFDPGMNSSLQNQMQKGLETRDMKWVYLATLVRMVRAE